MYLSAIVISNPEITVSVDRHTVWDTRYVVGLEIVERFAVRCWEIEIVLSDISFKRKKNIIIRMQTKSLQIEAVTGL